ncbi:MAG: hypothetical protein NVSMB57_15100 [Actinomycetota bacterium]
MRLDPQDPAHPPTKDYRMRRLVLLATLLLMSVMPAAPAAPAAPPIVPAGTGLLTSDNVSLVFTIPDEGMVGGHFFSHYFVTTTANTDPFAPSPHGGVRIYDIANPEMPSLIGILSLPHGENEDVDVSQSRQFLLVSMETYARFIGGAVAGDAWPVRDHLYVVSIQDPKNPKVIGTLDYPTTVKSRAGKAVEGPGHIANCIQDCKRYAYVTGAEDGAIYIVDLKDPTKPALAGSVPGAVNHAAFRGNPNETTGYVHDVNTDQYGQVWVTGKGGTSQIDVKNPLKPKPLRWLYRTDNFQTNHSIHHNALLLDRKTLLVTEEDYVEPQCGPQKAPVDPPVDTRPPGTNRQGSFQTWAIRSWRKGAGGIVPLAQWVTELMSYSDATTPSGLTKYRGGSAAAEVYCSSHWFTFNKRKVVAVAWYNQGVRFLDVTNPRNIRQIGYFIGPATQASAAYFVPGHDDLVYVADYNRGFDVVRLSAPSPSILPSVVAPLRQEWLTGGIDFRAFVPRRGYGCLVRRFSPNAAHPY